MKVKFTELNEYLDELKQDHPKIVRVTNRYEMSRATPNIRHLSVVSTYVNKDRQLVRLDRYIGDYLGRGVPGADKVTLTAEGIEARIITTAKALKIEVRAGVIEP